MISDAVFICRHTVWDLTLVIFYSCLRLVVPWGQYAPNIFYFSGYFALFDPFFAVLLREVCTSLFPTPCTL